MLSSLGRAWLSLLRIVGIGCVHESLVGGWAGARLARRGFVSLLPCLRALASAVAVLASVAGSGRRCPPLDLVQGASIDLSLARARRSLFSASIDAISVVSCCRSS